MDCRCASRAPEVIDNHGLTPQGFEPSLIPEPSCALCGGTGRTTRARVVAGALGGVLFVAACGLPVAAIVAVALADVALAAGLLALATASLFAARSIESRLRRNAPAIDG